MGYRLKNENKLERQYKGSFVWNLNLLLIFSNGFCVQCMVRNLVKENGLFRVQVATWMASASLDQLNDPIFLKLLNLDASIFSLDPSTQIKNSFIPLRFMHHISGCGWFIKHNSSQLIRKNLIIPNYSVQFWSLNIILKYC